MNKLNVYQLESLLDEQLLKLSEESTDLNNKKFSRECQKSKELANLAGKKIAIIGQQLWALEMGSQGSVPSLDIEKGQVMYPNKLLRKIN